MQKAQSNSNSITVTITRFGHNTQTVSVAEGSTVAQVLESAGIVLAGLEELFVEGQTAESNDILEDGDLLSIVTPKQAG